MLPNFNQDMSSSDIRHLSIPKPKNDGRELKQMPDITYPKQHDDYSNYNKDNTLKTILLNNRFSNGTLTGNLLNIVSMSLAENLDTKLKSKKDNYQAVLRGLLGVIDGSTPAQHTIFLGMRAKNVTKFVEQLKNKYGIDIYKEHVKIPVYYQLYNVGYLYKVPLDRDTYFIVTRFTTSKDYTNYIGLFFFGKNKTYHWLKHLRLFYKETYNDLMYQLKEVDEDSPKYGRVDDLYTSATYWRRVISPYKKEIFNYLSAWKDCSELYNKFGKSHKTGILLEGPTGTGKTTMAIAIADLLKYNYEYIDFSMPLKEQFRNIRPNTVVIMEELDTKIGKRIRVDDEDNKLKFTEKSEKIDLTGELLQLMDGDRKYNRVVFIATTNDVTKLDDAILRSGRFDKIYRMDNFDEKSAIEMCKTYEVNPKVVLKDVTYPIRPSDVEQLINEYFMLKLLNIQRIKEKLKTDLNKDLVV